MAIQSFVSNNESLTALFLEAVVNLIVLVIAIVKLLKDMDKPGERRGSEPADPNIELSHVELCLQKEVGAVDPSNVE